MARNSAPDDGIKPAPRLRAVRTGPSSRPRSGRRPVRSRSRHREHGPSTAAINGLRRRRRRISPYSPPRSVRASAPSRRSVPALNTSGVPVSTPTHNCSSSSRVSSASLMPKASSRLTALRFSGRCIVMTRIRSRRCTSTLIAPTLPLLPVGVKLDRARHAFASPKGQPERPTHAVRFGHRRPATAGDGLAAARSGHDSANEHHRHAPRRSRAATRTCGLVTCASAGSGAVDVVDDVVVRARSGRTGDRRHQWRRRPAGELRGSRVGPGFRATVGDLLGYDVERATLLNLLLDDWVGASLVSGYGTQHAAIIDGAEEKMADVVADHLAGICSGFAPDAAVVDFTRRNLLMPCVHGPLAPELTDGPRAASHGTASRTWHATYASARPAPRPRRSVRCALPRLARRRTRRRDDRARVHGRRPRRPCHAHRRDVRGRRARVAVAGVPRRTRQRGAGERHDRRRVTQPHPHRVRRHLHVYSPQRHPALAWATSTRSSTVTSGGPRALSGLGLDQFLRLWPSVAMEFGGRVDGYGSRGSSRPARRNLGLLSNPTVSASCRGGRPRVDGVSRSAVMRSADFLAGQSSAWSTITTCSPRG